MTDKRGEIALGAGLLLVVILLAIAIWAAAIRTNIERVEIRPPLGTTPAVTSTSEHLPCCPAGTHGRGGAHP